MDGCGSPILPSSLPPSRTRSSSDGGCGARPRRRGCGGWFEMARTSWCGSRYRRRTTMKFGLIGVPSSAGAHGPGQEKAPAALRQAGLLGALREAGLEVEDLGDLPVARFSPDADNRKRQSQPRVVKVARQVAEAVAGAVERELVPLVLGGDCTITLGVVAGLLRHQPDLGLIYFDGDADMTTPDTTHSGIFDSMGAAHLIGKGAPELARIGPRFPLLTPDRIALFGFQPYEVEPRELLLLEESEIPQYPVTSLDRPVERAAEALARLEGRARGIAEIGRA